MPSTRRLRLLFIGVIAAVVITLVYTSQLRASEEVDSRTFNDFWKKTREGLDKAHGEGAAQAVSNTNKGTGSSKSEEEDDAQLAKDMRARLEAAEQKAKDSANAKVMKPEKPEQVIGVGSSAGGQKKLSGDKAGGDSAGNKETEEDHQVETTLNEILKKSPVIIFSKTYCQYSKRAKAVLLDKYNITPEPYVVELDIHPLGKQIQEKLGKMTSRTTVPNIIINGISIGGSDDILAMDQKDELVDKIRTLGSVGGKSLEVKDRVKEI
ncbi:glutaredoxin [Cryphonectria parasitica EP155]|uniref:Glutaredoxin n=1 Tax=Cryphonectria parasitica (strain ATCC 38755 / EP155) TaxID=660469 RepID=A0A9P4Y8M6_CRYP1|nr:glutaredoxin [Cryphonectria parasitica EP155]KAF3768982.1 glutaredoxin [Cryphonectria parasitica EP155]